LSSSEGRKIGENATQERSVSWVKVALAALAAAVPLSTVGDAAEVRLGSTSVAHETAGSSRGQADPDARFKPAPAEDQGALWTPENAGVAYDLSDPNDDQFLPIKVR
jgi:hypothetical protein